MRKTFTTYSTCDPAIASLGHRVGEAERDAALKAVLKYEETRDPADLPPLNGAVPVTFRYRRLRSSQTEWVDEATTLEGRATRYFMAGVVEIVFADGTRWAPEGIEAKPFVAMTREELDGLLDEHIGQADVHDVAAVIRTRSQLRPKAVPRFPVVRSSARAWDALQHPTAVESPGPETSSSEPPSGGEG